MAANWSEDVRKYIADADEGVIAAIVRYCGIALRNPDSALVSFTDPKELARVRANFLKKKLGLAHSDAELDAGLAAVGERMKADRTKNRVTVYYLLLEHFGAHAALRKPAKPAATASAPAKAKPAMKTKAAPKAKAAPKTSPGIDAGPAKSAGANALGLANLDAAPSPAAPTPAEAAPPASIARAAGTADASASGVVTRGEKGDRGSDLGWLWWLLLALLVAFLLWWLFLRGGAAA